MSEFLYANKTTVITNLMVLCLTVGMIVAFVLRNRIHHWGYLMLALLAFGLVVCCFAAGRDGLDKTIQNRIDGSVASGVFPLISVPTILGSICAVILVVIGIVSLCIPDPNVRKVLFFVMSGTVIAKILIIEISRAFLLLS